MKRIGILRGMETTFPEALIHYINEHFEDVQADFVMLDAVRMDGEAHYDVIIDRISHEVPYYRSFLKWTAIKGTYIINNPFWWSADDKFIDNIIAESVDVAVPKTVILPHKNYPPNTQSTSFRNLRYPINWDDVFNYVGFPSFLKPFDGGGWRDVSKVNNTDQFFRAYDQSGDDCMMLQEGIEFDSYFRCYGIGRKYVHIMKYNPGAEPHLRYHDVPQEAVTEELYNKMHRDVLALCQALGYDMNTVEFAVRDGIPYAIDFMNPAPDADYNSVGAENFDWVVRHMADFAVEKAREGKKPRAFNIDDALGSHA